MKKQEKLSSIAGKNSGITLIALVITIIVLLILAGVSLSLITGSDGILGRSEKAVDQTNISSGKEQAELLVADYLSEYYEEGYVNAKQDVATQAAEAYIQSKITETGMATSSGDYFVTIGSDNAITVYKGTNADENNKTAEGTLLSGGKVEWSDVATGGSGQTKTLSSQITADNYGDYVDLGTSLIVNDNIALEDGTNPTTDWRIFHKDETGGTYLILADYLPYSYETTVGSGLKNGGSSYPYNWKGSESRADLLTRLADTSAWNNLISSSYTAKGINVTGALDLETWIASWNAKGYTKLYTAKSTGMSDGLDGYYVGTSENPTSPYQDVSSDTTGYGNSLYFPHKSSLSNNHGYWLATPSETTADRANSYVMYVQMTAGLGGHHAYGYYKTGVRPAVYLPSDIKAEKVDGVWEIEQ